MVSPRIRSRRIATRDLYFRFMAGRSMLGLARRHGLTVAEVEARLRFYAATRIGSRALRSACAPKGRA